MITFYATVDADSLPRTVQHLIPQATPILLPASSFHRRGFKVPILPAHITDRAADSGGFVATFKWGDYRYSADEYVTWLATWRPAWAALMDYCCEPQIAGGPDVVRARQDRTTARAYEMWQAYQGAPWAWVPTIQGWETADYTRHARDMAPLIAAMRAHYPADSAFRVGIGTLCRRASTQQIRAVVRAVAAELPGVGLHLWGVKVGALQDRIALPEQVVSVDSAAWNGFFGTDNQLWKGSGQTKRAYGYAVALPAYQTKIDAALAGPKQEEMAL